MIISDFAIKRPMITVVTMVALVVFGLFALWRLQTDEFPDIQQPVVLTFIPYPGASPEGVERELLKPVEDAIKGISGVDKIYGTAGDGYAQIITLFVFEKDPQVGTQDIRDAISGIRQDLPVEMKEPVLQRFDPSDQPIVSMTLASPTLTPAQLTRLADPDITSKLRGIPGIAQVQIVGGVKREMTINLQPQALQAAGISVGQVVQGLQAQNLAAPVGRVNGNLDERTIRLQGRLEGPQDFENLVVAERGGQIVRLGQVADAVDGTQEQRSLALYNGVEAVGINIVKSKGYSTTDVSSKVRAKVAEIQKTLPPGVKIDVVKDSGLRVKASVNNVEEALLIGALLTVLVVFVFLNSWRSTVITGLALPVSVMASFIAVWSFGFTLNTMSLLGLSLAIGILIDDAIVVRENIVRHIEMGKDHMTASHEGTDEIGLAVAATTFSIVAVFVPVAFMYGIAGQWFKPFALTIACAVLVSLFVSFSLDPMLSAYWADPQLEAHERKNPVARALDRFNAWFDRQADRYKGVIAWALDHRVAVIVIVAVAFFGAIALQVLIGGGGFIPDSDRSEINLSLETPPGSNLNYTALKAREIAAIASAHKEVAYTYTTIGSSTGSGSVDTGSIYIKLVPKKKRHVSQQQIAQVIRREIQRVGGTTAYLATSGGPGGITRQIQLQLGGQNLETLNRAALAMESQERQVNGTADVGLSTRGQRPELVVQLNRGLASTLGLNVGQVAQSLRPAFAGIKAGDWIDPLGKTRDVTVRLAPSARENLTDIEQLPLVVTAGAPGGSGATVSPAGVPAGAPGQSGMAGTPSILPLGQVASVSRSSGPAQIDHLNRDKVVTVGANVQGRSLSEVMRDVTKRNAGLRLPPDVTLSQGGDVKNESEVFTKI